MALYFIKKEGYSEDLSVFGACDERGFLGFCFYSEKEIIGLKILEKTEEEYWAESLIRAVMNSLELNGGEWCEYRGNDYLKQFKICRFKEENGVLKVNLKEFFANGGKCCHG